MPGHMTYMCIYETALCSNEISVFKMLFLVTGNVYLLTRVILTT